MRSRQARVRASLLKLPRASPRLACAALSAPIGAITFIESERQWIKAEQGLGLHETHRDQRVVAIGQA